jgi:lipopolysaccharide export LptBFGC system permease protein LptF
MKKILTCNQVFALINFYLEDSLTPSLRKKVDEHLAKCPNCKNKINELKNILNQYETQSLVLAQAEPQNMHIDNLSAYMDNELGNSENIKIKKMMIANPDLRQELENMYKFKKLLHSAFIKTKSETKTDYSKEVVSKIYDSNPYSTTYFYKIACVFVFLISAILVGFIYLYF